MARLHFRINSQLDTIRVSIPRSTCSFHVSCSTIFVSNSYLKHSANIKLHWCAPHDEVCGLVDVSNGPHDHHQKAHAVRGLVLVVAKELGQTWWGRVKS